MWFMEPGIVIIPNDVRITPDGAIEYFELQASPILSYQAASLQLL